MQWNALSGMSIIQTLKLLNSGDQSLQYLSSQFGKNKTALSYATTHTSALFYRMCNHILPAK